MEVESWAEAASEQGTMQYKAWSTYSKVRRGLSARSLLARYHNFLRNALSHPPYQWQLISSYPFKAWLKEVKEAVEERTKALRLHNTQDPTARQGNEEAGSKVEGHTNTLCQQ